MASWEGFFTGLQSVGSGIVNYKLEQEKLKSARITAATEAKRLENQNFEREAALKKSLIEVAAQVTREETYYKVAMALAVGIGAALIGAVVAQILKAMKK